MRTLLKKGDKNHPGAKGAPGQEVPAPPTPDAVALAAQVERFPLSHGGVDGLQAGRAGRQQHHQLDDAGVELLPSPELDLPALEVAVVPVVGGVLDPEVVPPQAGLVIHPENKEMFQNFVFPTVATVPMIKHQRVDRLK